MNIVIKDEIEMLLSNNNIDSYGFAKVNDGPAGLSNAISIVVPLSDAVIDEIDNAPTYSYFHHYRTVNSYIDNVLLQLGLLLQKNGYRYFPIAASQSQPIDSERTHMGRYSHKKVAVLAGLGSIGKSTLFIHKRYGPRVRLGTIFTDCPLPTSSAISLNLCDGCNLCVISCPAKAIKGVEWYQGIDRKEMFNADKCNNYMREHFMKIGRGSVCGICVKVCPYSTKK